MQYVNAFGTIVDPEFPNKVQSAAQHDVLFVNQRVEFDSDRQHQILPLIIYSFIFNINRNFTLLFSV